MPCTSSRTRSSPCVAELAQVPKLLGCELAHAALALHRFEQDAGGLIADRRLDRSEIAERRLVEAVDLRAKSFEIFRLAAGDRASVRPWKAPSKVTMR